MHDSIGILKVIHRLNMERDREVINLICEAAESFSAASIKRCPLMSKELKEYFLKAATRPISLRHQCRLRIRKLLTEIARKANEHIWQRQQQQQQNEFEFNSIGQCTLFRSNNPYDSLSEIEQERLNRMTVDEIEDAFVIGGNGDPEKLKLLTILLKRSSSKPIQSVPIIEEIIERINNLPIPSILRCYLNYEISFRSFHEVIAD